MRSSCAWAMKPYPIGIPLSSPNPLSSSSSSSWPKPIAVSSPTLTSPPICGGALLEPSARSTGRPRSAARVFFLLPPSLLHEEMSAAANPRDARRCPAPPVSKVLLARPCSFILFPHIFQAAARLRRARLLPCSPAPLPLSVPLDERRATELDGTVAVPDKRKRCRSPGEGDGMEGSLAARGAISRGPLSPRRRRGELGLGLRGTRRSPRVAIGGPRRRSSLSRSTGVQGTARPAVAVL